MSQVISLDGHILVMLVKSSLALGIGMGLAALCIWIERKGSALIQDRIGANRASFFGFDLAGIFNTLVADPVKAITKEDFVPKGVSQIAHSIAPFLSLVPVLLCFAVFPFGPAIEWSMKENNIINHYTVHLTVAPLEVGVLYLFAMGSIAVYGSVIAGWVSNNKFSLFGGLRSTAQMISYEVTMSLSILGTLAAYQTLNLERIVELQGGTLLGGLIPAWGIFQLFPFNLIAFVIFFTSLMAETKRAPFDLPESESELVAGYLTEYSGMKFLLFWFGEFAEIAVASAFVVTMFFGGWQLPYINVATLPLAPLIGIAVFLAKIIAFCTLQIIIRWTLPRFRYDQLMSLCWKIMLPISIVNLLASIVTMLLIA